MFGLCALSARAPLIIEPHSTSSTENAALHPSAKQTSRTLYAHLPTLLHRLKAPALSCERALLHPVTLCLGGQEDVLPAFCGSQVASYARPTVGNCSNPSLPGKVRHNKQRAKLRKIPAEHLGKARGVGQVLTPDIAGANAHDFHSGCVLVARLVLLLCKVRLCCTIFHLNFLRMPNPLLPLH